MSALLTAATEFLRDEERRARRRQRSRLDQSTRRALEREIRALTDGRLTAEDTRALAVARGEAAVMLFGYDDTFDAAAETVIVDILHAVAAYGWNPQNVIDAAIRYYAEERQQ